MDMSPFSDTPITDEDRALAARLWAKVDAAIAKAIRVPPEDTP